VLVLVSLGAMVFAVGMLTAPPAGGPPAGAPCGVELAQAVSLGVGDALVPDEQAARATLSTVTTASVALTLVLTMIFGSFRGS
jgi:hypothetical protein